MKKLFFRFKLYLFRIVQKSIERTIRKVLTPQRLKGFIEQKIDKAMENIDLRGLACEVVDFYDLAKERIDNYLYNQDTIEEACSDAVSEVDIDEKVDDAVESELAGFNFDYRVDEAIQEALGEFDFKESIKATIKEVLTVEKLECEVVDYLNGLKFDRVANNIFREALKHYLATVDALEPLTDEND